MDKGPIIKRERWRADDEGVEKAKAPAPAAAEEASADPPVTAAPRRVPLPVLAVTALLLGVAMAFGAYSILRARPAGSPLADVATAPPPELPTLPPASIGPDDPEPVEQADETVDVRNDIEILVRLWHLASLTQEEVTSIRQGLLADIEGTKTAEAMRIALSAKQRELTDRKNSLAEQLRAIAVEFRATPVPVREQFAELIDDYRASRKDASARWLEVSANWMEAMPDARPTAGYFLGQIDKSI